MAGLYSHRSAAGINDDRRLLHRGELLVGDHPACLVSERYVKGDDVRRAQQLGQSHPLRVGGGFQLRVDLDLVVVDDLALPAGEPFRHPGADLPQQNPAHKSAPAAKNAEIQIIDLAGSRERAVASNWRMDKRFHTG